MKEEQREYVSIVTTNIVRAIKSMRGNDST
jgi:hypothetical protein